jgi:hypothetical protein
MKRPNSITSSVEASSACKDQVFQAIHELVMNGHANLYLVSKDDYWLRLATGEAFALGEQGVLRII